MISIGVAAPLGAECFAPKGARYCFFVDGYKYFVPYGTIGFGYGRRSRTFNFEFKARRVASYTIPQNIADCQLPIEKQQDAWSGQSAFSNRQLAMTMVAVEGIEPTSLDYQSSALAVELHRDG